MNLDSDKSLIREFVKSSRLDFPDERMGTGDKLILKRVAREELDMFRANYPEYSARSALFILTLRKAMEKYGYKTAQDNYW